MLLLWNIASVLERQNLHFPGAVVMFSRTCLLYTSDAADDLLCVDLGGRRIIKKKKQDKTNNMVSKTPTNSQDNKQ